MLSINELQPGIRIKYNNKPYEIIKSEHIKMAQSHGIQRVRMRNLADGTVLDETFKGNQTLPELDFTRSKAQFLYCDLPAQAGDAVCHFMNQVNFDQFTIAKKTIGPKAPYLSEGQEYTIVFIEELASDIDLPTKVTISVKEAPPGLRGDRSSAGTKQIVLENGLTINAPLYIKPGEKILVDTRTGQFISRA